MPIIQKLISAYKLWHSYLLIFEKVSRYNIGSKIDSLFLETIESVFIATHKTREQKNPYLNKASDKLDVLKFLLQVAWEIKALDNKKYIRISIELNEIGKMLGGWLKQTKTP